MVLTLWRVKKVGIRDVCHKGSYDLVDKNYSTPEHMRDSLVKNILRDFIWMAVDMENLAGSKFSFSSLMKDYFLM